MSPTILSVFFVFLGGGLGSVARFLAIRVIPSTEFPYSTFAVNIVGSFLIGIAMAKLALPQQESTYSFAVVGFLGGFTTFSAFSLDNLKLIQNGNGGQALFNIAAQVTLGIGAAVLGMLLAGRSGTIAE